MGEIWSFSFTYVVFSYFRIMEIQTILPRWLAEIVLILSHVTRIFGFLFVESYATSLAIVITQTNNTTSNMGPTAVKRRKLSKTSTRTTDSATESEDNPHDVFRKFFESQFRPLDEVHTHKKDAAAAVTSQTSDGSDDDDDVSGDEDFEGFSDNGRDDEKAKITVVEHVDIRNENVLLDKQTRKAILVCCVNSKLSRIA